MLYKTRVHIIDWLRCFTHRLIKRSIALIHRCVYLYCVLLPFGLVDSLGWMTPVIVCFIAYTFLALEALGAELEDPFGIEPNDLALEALAHGIEASVLSMAGELPRTPEPHPVDFVLR